MYSICILPQPFCLVQKAKEQGDFLLVGLHTDEDVAERRGPHLPIMDLHERCLSVLACKYVDEVIIGQHSIGQLHVIVNNCITVYRVVAATAIPSDASALLLPDLCISATLPQLSCLGL